jgi:hypothetical protein
MSRKMSLGFFNCLLSLDPVERCSIILELIWFSFLSIGSAFSFQALNLYVRIGNWVQITCPIHRTATIACQQPRSEEMGHQAA